MTGPFRCSAASRLRDDDIAGTASTVHAFLLVEHPGSWGRSALRDARVPDGLGPELARRARQAKVRPLLVRRHRQRRMGHGGIRVLASHTRRDAPWLEYGVMSSWADILDLDLAALSAGRSLGLTGLDESVFAVCTHGRHDPCCAELGRPVAAALASAHPKHTWECSHIGGDRFAGNVLVLPDGVYYGRVTADEAVRLAASHAAGRLELANLRGWCAQPVPVQVAEIALRRRLGEDRIAALRPVGAHRDGPTTTVRLDVEGAPWTVLVTAATGDGVARLTCHAHHADPLPNWQVTIHRGLTAPRTRH